MVAPSESVNAAPASVLPISAAGTAAARPAAVLGQSAMFLLCLVFLVLCVRSFIQARKARSA